MLGLYSAFKMYSDHFTIFPHILLCCRLFAKIKINTIWCHRQQLAGAGVWSLTSLVSQTSAPSVYMTNNFWLPFPGAKRIFFTQPRCVGIPLKASVILTLIYLISLHQTMKETSGTAEHCSQWLWIRRTDWAPRCEGHTHPGLTSLLGAWGSHVMKCA